MDERAYLLWFAVALGLLWTGRHAYAGLTQSTTGTIVATAAFLTGAGLLVAVTVGVGLERHATSVGLWVALVFGAIGVHRFGVPASDFFASDVALFESYASTLLLQGQNPMAADMSRAAVALSIDPNSAALTPLASGGTVDAYSYPGGTLWLSAVDQALVPGPRVGLTFVGVSAVFLAWVVVRVDAALVPLALLGWVAPVERVGVAASGMLSPLWLFPLTVGVAAWYDERWRVAAVALGVAVAAKQLAWPVAGLILVHILATRGRAQAARVAALSGVVASVLIGPWVLWNPVSYAETVVHGFTSVGGAVVAQGVGLTTLTTAGLVTVPRPLHSLLVAGVALVLIGATWRWPGRMQYAIPFAGLAVLVVHYRTLPSYYAMVVPLALIALDSRQRVSHEN